MTSSDSSVPAILAAGLLLGLGLAPIVLLGSEPHSAIHSGPNALPEGAQLAMGSVADLDPALQTLIVRGPARAPSAEDVADLLRFVRNGGQLLIADDSPVGDALLKRLASGIDLGSSGLLTPSFVGTPDRVLVESVSQEIPLPERTVLTHPRPVFGGAPLLRIAGPAWIDADGDGRAESSEPPSDGVVAAVQQFGSGSILVVGDPDALAPGSTISSALEAWATRDGRTIVFDERHHATSNPFGLATALAGRAAGGWTMLCLAVAVLIFAVAVLRPRRQRRGVTTRSRRSAAADAEAFEAISELERT